MDFSLIGVFGAGLLTFLSPCVLPLVPVLVASLLVAEKAEEGAPRAPGLAVRVLSTLWFSAGFTLVFVLFGLSVPALTSWLGALKPWLMALGGVVVALFGLKMLGLIEGAGPLSWMQRSLKLPDLSRKAPRGLQGLLFGAVFGAGWTPCVGPVLGAVLSYVASKEASPARGALMLLVFSLGITLPLVVVAALSARATPWLARLRRHLPKIEAVSGAGLLVYGVLLFTQAAAVSEQWTTKMATGPGLDRPVTAVDTHGERIALGEGQSEPYARMVFFHTDHCPVCHAMEQWLGEFESSCGSEAFKFSRVNVERMANSAAATRYNIHAVPTISVFDGNGTEVLHLVGYQSEMRLREAARSITRLVCRERPKEPRQPELPLPSAACTVGEKC